MPKIAKRTKTKIRKIRTLKSPVKLKIVLIQAFSYLYTTINGLKLLGIALILLNGLITLNTLKDLRLTYPGITSKSLYRYHKLE